MESVDSRNPSVRSAGIHAPGRDVPVRLAGLGLISVLLYGLGLAARYPIQAGFQIPRATWTSLVASPGLALAVHLAVYAGLTFAYLLSINLVWRRGAAAVMNGEAVCPKPQAGSGANLAVIVAGWLLASAVLLGVSPGGESHDVYDYLFRGRMWVEFGGNPLADVPRQFSKAPFYRYIAWHSHVDTYGPVWEYASGGVAVLVRTWLQATERWGSGLPSCPQLEASCRMLLTYVTGYRLLAIVMAGVCGWLIHAIVRRNRPEQADTALLIWLWNPLLLIAAAVGAHNDLVMLVLLLLVFWLFQHQMWLAGLTALVLAAHVKLTALVLAPVIGLWLLRRMGWRRALAQATLALVLAIPISWLLYAPLGGWDTLPRMLRERSIFVAHSPWHLVYQMLHANLQWPNATVLSLIVYGATALFGAAALAIGVARFGYGRRGAEQTVDDETLWSAAAVVTAVYLAVGSFWFQHWYVLWALAAAALLPDSRYTRTALPWLCFGALSGNALSDLLPWLPDSSLDRTQVIAIVLAATWLPALAATAYVWRTRGWPATWLYSTRE